jgi:hypothetical protein
MPEATLVTHCGARRIEPWELEQIDAPPPTETWFPVKHSLVLNSATRLLNEAGYQIEKQALAVSHEGNRFFGTLNLKTELSDGVGLAVGIRNSCDKTFPMGFVAGNRVFVCDNLAFRSELMVKRKHTTFGRQRFTDAIASAITSLLSFKEVERQRIECFRQTQIGEERVSHYLLQAALQDVVALRQVPKILSTYHNLTDRYDKTAWALFNAFTSVLGPIANRNPNVYAAKTIRLNSLLLPRSAIAEQQEASHALAV